MNTIWMAFLTGLTTGGISCLAVQGGLLTSSLSAEKTGESNPSPMSRVGSVSMFLAAKIVAHILVGFLLGLIGSTLVFAPKVMGLVQIVVGVFMLATAARVLELHPIFRYAVIQPPRWVYKLAKRSGQSGRYVAPALIGFFTVLMPCGVTQATMAVAVASGNPLLGAAIMGAFVLGTSPVFFTLGAAVGVFLDRPIFRHIAAGVIAVFAIISINGGMAMQGSIYTLQNFYKAATTEVTLTNASKQASVGADGFQKVSIDVTDNGYIASADTLRVGVPVRVTLSTERTRGCARAFTVPEYGISKILPETGEEVVEFTPKEVGTLAYSCSMGMYTGHFTIIE